MAVKVAIVAKHLKIKLKNQLRMIIPFFLILISNQALAVTNIIIPSPSYPSPYTDTIHIDGPGPNSLTLLSNAILSVQDNNVVMVGFIPVSGDTVVNLETGSILENISIYNWTAIGLWYFTNPTDTFTLNVAGTIRFIGSTSNSALITSQEFASTTINLLNGGEINGDITNGASNNAVFTLNLGSGTLNGAYNNSYTNVGVINVIAGATFITGNIFSSQFDGVDYLFNNNGNFTANHSLTNIATFTNAIDATSNINNILSAQTIKNSGIFNLQNNANISATAFVNDGTINVYGGTLNSPITSQISNSQFNVFSNFTLQTPITGVGIITVNHPSTTLIVASAISGFQLFQINDGAMVEIENNGTIEGDIIGSPSSLLMFNSDFRTAGAITNVSDIVVNSCTLTVNNTISGFNNFINSGTVNLNGGNIEGPITGGGANSALNINHNATTFGILGYLIPLDTININGVNFTLRNTINANTVNNNGNLVLFNSQIINGNYVQTGGATLTSNILNANSGNYGQLVVNGTATIGGNIDVNVLNGGIQIHDQDTFTLITADNLIVDPPTITTHNSLFLTFTMKPYSPFANQAQITLIARRIPYQNIALDPAIAGVACALDQTRKTALDPELLQFLINAENVANFETFKQNLLQLIPNINGQAVLPSVYSPFTIFDEINNQNAHFISRQSNLRHSNLNIALSNKTSGYTAGDVQASDDNNAHNQDVNIDSMNKKNNFGPFVFANNIKRGNQGFTEGFTSNTQGVGILTDRWFTDCFQLGSAVSFSHTHSKSHLFGNKTNINSLQATLYSTWLYKWLFLDFMLAAAHNRYHTLRNIYFISSAAHAKFQGTQTAERVCLGVDVPAHRLVLSPEISLDYTHLHQKRFRERGAGIANLIVFGKGISASQLSYGLRIYEVSCSEVFLPEIHAFAINYIKNPNLINTAQFTGFGPAFVAIGKPLPKKGINLGASVSARLSECSLLTGQYDLEKQRKLSFHSFFIKYQMLF